MIFQILFSILVDLKPVCHNKGTVIKVSDGVYTCQCLKQYTGPYCESGKSSLVVTIFAHQIEMLTFLFFLFFATNLDVNKCFNGGTTTYSAAGWSCACPSRYTGENCQAGNFKITLYIVVLLLLLNAKKTVAETCK